MVQTRRTGPESLRSRPSSSRGADRALLSMWRRQRRLPGCTGLGEGRETRDLLLARSATAGPSSCRQLGRC